METDSRKRNAPRAVNDHIFNTMWGADAEEVALLCQCRGSYCPVVVPMTPSEYVRLRDRGELVYAPGHEDAIPWPSSSF